MNNLENLRNKAKDIKIIFFDIDDTLRMKDTGFMPKSIDFVMQQLKMQNIKTSIASGRAYFGIINEIRALNFDYYITINGSLVVDKQHNVIFDKKFDIATTTKVLQFAKNQHFELAFIGQDKAIRTNFFGEEFNELINFAMAPVYGDLAIDNDFPQTNAVYQFLTFCNNQDDEKIPKDLENIRSVRWHKNSCDLVFKEMSKRFAIEKLTKQLGFAKENICVFGDGLNDLEMFDYAGLAIAMGNGREELKAKADFVAKNAVDDGILDALQQLQIIR